MSVWSAACAALAAFLLVPAPVRSGGRAAAGPGPRSEARRGADARARPGAGAVTGVVAAGALLARSSPRWAVLVAIGGLLLAGATALWRARRRRRAAVVTSLRVLETCELLAAELGAGRPPGTALDHAARSWAELAPVAEAFRVGADVPAALRRVAGVPGAADLRLVAAAWQVAHRTGQGLADAVDRVAGGLRAAQASRRVVEGELASARATARLVAGLPVLALSMGSGAGGDPWGFLVGQPVGLACLAGGLALGLAGLAWIEALARDVDRSA
jgi:tight adherence protein B